VVTEKFKGPEGKAHGRGAGNYVLISVLIAVLSLFISFAPQGMDTSQATSDTPGARSEFEESLGTLLSVRSSGSPDEPTVYAFYQPVFEADSTALDATTVAMTSAIVEKLAGAPAKASITILLTDKAPADVMAARLEVIEDLLADSGVRRVRLGTEADSQPGLRIMIAQDA